MLGRRHPIVRRLRALRRSGALRREEGVLLAEGLHLAGEALAAGVEIELALVSPRLERLTGGGGLRERLDASGVRVETMPDDLLESLQDARSPQPVMLVIRRIETGWASIWNENGGPPLLVVACGVQDPGNLGSMLRSAHAAGAGGFVTLGGGADLFHPRTIRATMGSIFGLPCFSATEDPLFRELRSHRLSCLGAVPSGGRQYDRVDLRRPLALFFGEEGRGIGPALLARMDDTLTIPLRSGVESLSVGAAAAVLLFEAARQRRHDQG